MCNGNRSLSLSCFKMAKMASTNNKQHSSNRKAATVFTIFTAQLMVYSSANSEILVLSYFEKKKEIITTTMDISHITDNKKFWKTVKPFFSDKSHSNNKIVLTEGEKIISNDVEVAETMNEFFVTVTDSLGINENSNNENATEGISDPDEKAVQKFANHPSILKIKGHYQNAGPFVFQKVTPDAVDKEIRNLNPKKATTHKNIPSKILKSNSDLCVEPLTQIFNDCVDNSTFHDELKCADVTSLPKNGPTNTRTNFRPISVLPTVSKLFERIMDNR